MLLHSLLSSLLWCGFVWPCVQQRVGGKQKKGKGGRGPGVLFADVAGVDEAKEELEEIVVSSFGCPLCAFL